MKNEGALKMQPRKKAIFIGLMALTFSTLQTTTYAGQNFPCWMQHIEENEGKIYIRFLPNYHHLSVAATRSKERKDEMSPVDTRNPLVLSEGESASVGEGLHSGCKMSAARKDQEFGLQVETYVSLPGLPAGNTVKFFPAAKHDESQQPK